MTANEVGGGGSFAGHQLDPGSLRFVCCLLNARDNRVTFKM
jgi:hypothetical protein